MIVDTARITLSDGSTKAAIELFPQAKLLSYQNQKTIPTMLVKTKIENHNDVMCLVLANGQRLIGSRDQQVCVHRAKKIWYSQMADIEIGDQLRGIAAGMATIVRVIGILYFQKHQMRLVEFAFNGKHSFVAEGVLCRS